MSGRLTSMVRALVVFTLAVAPILFFVAYCRSLLTRTLRIKLDERALGALGIQCGIPSVKDFPRLQALVRLCPMQGKDETPLASVCTYYLLLNTLEAISSAISDSFAAWTERERRKCSQFVAVTLDRRIQNTRKLWSEQLTSPEP